MLIDTILRDTHARTEGGATPRNNRTFFRGTVQSSLLSEEQRLQSLTVGDVNASCLETVLKQCLGLGLGLGTLGWHC